MRQNHLSRYVTARKGYTGERLHYAPSTTFCSYRGVFAGPCVVRGHAKPCDDEMVRPSYSTSLQGLPLAKMVLPLVAF